MRLIFMGTPAFAVATLEALAAAGHEVAAVYTRPPRRAGRGQAPLASPVQAWAAARGICVRTPARFAAPETVAALAALRADIAIVAAYGIILPPAVLEAPARGCLNVHASLLPRWRGAAPIQRAIQAGDAESGITIMQMTEGLDCGPILLQRRLPVAATATGGELHDALAALGGTAVAAALDRLDRLVPQPQPEESATWARRIDKAEARIDWSQPAAWIERTVRAFDPAPGAFLEAGGERIRVLRAEVDDAAGTPPAASGTVLDGRLTVACGAGTLRPVLVQRQGRRPMPAADLLRGFALPPGTVLA